ncbi:histone-fold-containing protein [Roridomyces roridus]|uniref:Histone H4 n=1 Tax=Roridomyces roridus TaxID=1738132 RepID=A0AAD7BM39_9AGAR|nr:histone-fold-containing protein [Roridomyces roridus]
MPSPNPSGQSRHRRRIRRQSIESIPRPTLRRLMRRGGVKRAHGLMYEETRGVLSIFLRELLRDTVVYTQHACRTTASAADVVRAVRRSGRQLYGFNAQV